MSSILPYLILIFLCLKGFVFVFILRTATTYKVALLSLHAYLHCMTLPNFVFRVYFWLNFTVFVTCPTWCYFIAGDPVSAHPCCFKCPVVFALFVSTFATVNKLALFLASFFPDRELALFCSMKWSPRTGWLNTQLCFSLNIHIRAWACFRSIQCSISGANSLVLLYFISIKIECSQISI